MRASLSVVVLLAVVFALRLQDEAKAHITVVVNEWTAFLDQEHDPDKISTFKGEGFQGKDITDLAPPKKKPVPMPPDMTGKIGDKVRSLEYFGTQKDWLDEILEGYGPANAMQSATIVKAQVVTKVRLFLKPLGGDKIPATLSKSAEKDLAEVFAPHFWGCKADSINA